MLQVPTGILREESEAGKLFKGGTDLTEQRGRAMGTHKSRNKRARGLGASGYKVQRQESKT